MDVSNPLQDHQQGGKLLNALTRDPQPPRPHWALQLTASRSHLILTPRASFPLTAWTRSSWCFPAAFGNGTSSLSFLLWSQEEAGEAQSAAQACPREAFSRPAHIHTVLGARPRPMSLSTGTLPQTHSGGACGRQAVLYATPHPICPSTALNIQVNK